MRQYWYFSDFSITNLCCIAISLSSTSSRSMDTNHTAKARMHNFLYIQFNFERKVICLQACIRGYLLRLRLRRKEIQKSINLGSLIGFQACARGFLIRQQMKLKRKDEYRDILLLERLVTKNIIRLQAYTRGFLLRQRMRIEEQYKIGKLLRISTREKRGRQNWHWALEGLHLP